MPTYYYHITYLDYEIVQEKYYFAINKIHPRALNIEENKGVRQSATESQSRRDYLYRGLIVDRSLSNILFFYLLVFLFILNPFEAQSDIIKWFFTRRR